MQDISKNWWSDEWNTDNGDNKQQKGFEWANRQSDVHEWTNRDNSQYTANQQW